MNRYLGTRRGQNFETLICNSVVVGGKNHFLPKNMFIFIWVGPHHSILEATLSQNSMKKGVEIDLGITILNSLLYSEFYIVLLPPLPDNFPIFFFFIIIFRNVCVHISMHCNLNKYLHFLRKLLYSFQRQIKRIF